MKEGQDQGYQERKVRISMKKVRIKDIKKGRFGFLGRKVRVNQGELN